MSTASPHAQDPYLSAPSDQDELDFQASAIRLTPMGGSPNQSAGTGSSPNDRQNPAAMDYRANTSSPSNPVFLGPQGYTLSAGAGAGAVGAFQNQRSSSRTAHGGATAPTTQAWSSSMAVNPSQLLTPEPTNNNPTPTQAQASLSVSQDAHFGPSRPRISTSNLDANTNGSPIVMVEEVSRGDSPTDVYPPKKRFSRSPLHLSPQGPGELSSESEDNDTDDHRSISSLSVVRSHDGAWLADPSTGQGGLGPQSRGDEYVPSPNQVKNQHDRQDRNADITIWSATVSAATDGVGNALGIPSHRRNQAGSRLRARSTGDRPLQQQDYLSLKGDKRTPGPGVLIHESSEEDLSENESEVSSDEESAPVNVNDTGYDISKQEPFPSVDLTSTDDDGFRLYPWQDPPRNPAPRTEQFQPSSSHAAMVAFESRVRDLETASLAATIDNNSIINVRATLENFSLEDRPKKAERRPSLLKRPFSKLKRQASDLSLGQSNSPSKSKEDHPEPQRKDSGNSPRHRLSLHKHSRGSSINSAVIAMSSQIAAIGSNHSARAASPNTEATPMSLSVKGRPRARSEVPRPASPGLMDLMTSHGGPPVANLAHSAKPGSDTEQSPGSTARGAEGPEGADDDDETGMGDDSGLVMDFPAVSRLPVPTIEGFKAQIMQLNPLLEPALIHRFANEQLRRYENLVKLQQKHAQALTNRSCRSGKFCFALGGDASLLQLRKQPANSDTGNTQFRVTDFNQGRDQPYAMVEGAIAAAQFPPGVPLPPVSRLPAQFECPICFEVKKFQKPSDWSKHVHEDVQPFTCTFPQCNEPKSFKRKADWVRHENERHRQLEWWTCTYPDCSHTCYRKDNFVQHLVREHKMPEPKMKKSKASASEKPSEAQRERDIERLWEMVEQCRQETKQRSEQERCRFCGNICGNWKKLTVHLGKHLEQLAMPVLELSKQSVASSSTALHPTTTTSAANVGSTAGPEQQAPLAAAYQTSLQTHFQQGQYPISNTSPPVTGANPTIPFEVPLLNYTSISGEQFSMEPEPIADSGEQYPGYAVDQFGQSAALHPAQAQTTPLHANSVSYPPPYNAVPRPRTPDPNSGVLQDSYSSIGSQYPAQQVSMYPTQESYSGYHPSMAYTSASYSSGYPATQM
ncbi:hypothetical protein N7474_002882 [Penicillium riverlandense]|uniref:uncharacterized protein n=1 Tax=Penicillium riverlandense TaxID=1903569 RepID=UPI0025479428|nr:uncharacterized protein N7474_002882 [Penicillium riverlandense]KAJ5825744.1 hypothetical protein N7474_002882 [Penicillium riverlandense]